MRCWRWSTERVLHKKIGKFCGFNWDILFLLIIQNKSSERQSLTKTCVCMSLSSCLMGFPQVCWCNKSKVCKKTAKMKLVKVKILHSQCVISLQKIFSCKAHHTISLTPAPSNLRAQIAAVCFSPLPSPNAAYLTSGQTNISQWGFKQPSKRGGKATRVEDRSPNV